MELNGRNLVAVLFFVIIALFFFLSVLMMHPFAVPDESVLEDYVIAQGGDVVSGDNGVTAVILEYRSFDVLCGLLVVFIAGVGVWSVRRRMQDE